MTTNQPTPVILSDDDLVAIEARLHLTTDGDAVFVLGYVRALCQTVRAAWARIEKQDAIISAYENQDEEALAEAENL